MYDMYDDLPNKELRLQLLSLLKWHNTIVSNVERNLQNLIVFASLEQIGLSN